MSRKRIAPEILRLAGRALYDVRTVRRAIAGEASPVTIARVTEAARAERIDLDDLRAREAA
jgi:hypothetical protein